MTWILASGIMLFGSVILYINIRATEKYAISLETKNIAMFLPAMVFFLLRCLFTGEILRQGRGWTLYMVVGFTFFSWLANVYSLKGLSLAPNPGYSLILSKSYVVLSSLLAIPLLHAPFTWTDAIAILLIVTCSGLIVIGTGNEGKKQVSHSWVFYSLYAFVGWALLALFVTYLLRQGLPVLSIIFRMFLTTSSCILIDTYVNKKTISVPRKTRGYIGGITFGMILLNRGLVTGYALAPNPGYLNAINVASIACIALLSSWLFKDELSMRKMIGIVGVIVGVILLFVF